MKVIEIENVFFKYPTQKEWQLKGIDLTVYAGENVGIIGANGTGKSTLTKLLIGIHRPQKGTVKVLGSKSRWTKHYPEVGYIGDPGYNTEELGLPSSLKVGEIISIVDKLNPDVQDKIDLKELKKNLGLDDLESKNIGDLSTGQRKRLMAALTFLRNPDIVILDEPLDGLDKNIKKYVGNILKGYYSDSKKTIILISHNNGEIDSFADKVFEFEKGKLQNIQQKKFEIILDDSKERKVYNLKAGEILDLIIEKMGEAIEKSDTINITLKPINL